MKYLIWLAMAIALLGTSCALQSGAQSTVSAGAATPNLTAAPGALTIVPTIAETATPSTTTPSTFGSYDDPHDFRSFAARLDAAIQTADVRFFLDNVAFEDLKCEVDFPATSKPCAGKARGTLVQGIVAGVWASEGFGLDADGYDAFIREFLTKTDASAFDAYGDPRPRLYAYGIFKPEHRGSELTRETVQAFATRVTSESGVKIPGPGRSVLIVHVSFDGQRWRIVRLTVTPPLQQYPPSAALLDPSRPEAKEMLQYWRRWEPSPGLAPTKTAAPVRTATVKPSSVLENSVVTPEADRWKLFSSREHGFEFRYPESCRVAELDNSFNVGGRIELTILDAEGLELSEYVDRFAENRARNGDWMVESIRGEFLAGQAAMTVDYRFGGPKRFGTATFTLRNGNVFIWSLTAGGFTCDEPNVYGPIVSSFRFVR
ncbi:MAG: hypothetical protein HYY30_06780 [Chloroflexi bacterium]|nr:hypothetical protein [Chloroflexota bacterium]